MTSPAETLNDAQLIDRVRENDAEAFAELRRRHRSHAVRAARITAHDPDEADQVADAAFERLRAALTTGEGPRTSVAPYLRTVIRRGTLDTHRTPDDAHEAVDPAAVDGLPHATDPLTAAEDRNIIREAYESLPERWQRVLWFTEVEGRTPASLVPDLGSAASAVAAMAYRAREGLRQAYLAVHMSVAVSAECQPVVATLPAYVREALTPEDDVTVAIHLDACVECRIRRRELLLLVSNLRSVLTPALLGYRAGIPAATRPVAALGGNAAAGVAVAAGRAARTSAVAAMTAVSRRPRRAFKVAATAAVGVLAVAALTWAASSAFAPTTSADALGGDREPLAVTFEQTNEPEDAVTTAPTDRQDDVPAVTDSPEPDQLTGAAGDTPAASDTGEPPTNGDNAASDAGQPSANGNDTASDAGQPPANGDDAATASTGSTSGAAPADRSTPAPAGDGAAAGAGDDGSSGSGAGEDGNQGPSDGSDTDPDQQPVPPAGNDDGNSDDEEDEPTAPDDDPDEEEQQEEPGLIERVLCGLLQC